MRRTRNGRLVAALLLIATGCPGASKKGKAHPATSSVNVSPASGITANGVSTASITVLARDEKGAAVADLPVVLAATGNGNTIVQPAVTDADGVATGTIASTRAEEKTITTTVDGVALDQKPTVVFDPGAVSPAASLLTADRSEAAASGRDPVLLTGVLQDQFENPVPGVPVAFSAPQGAFIAPSQADAAGRVTGAYRSTVAGAFAVTLTINPGTANEVVIGQKPLVSFLASLLRPSKSGDVDVSGDGSLVVTTNPDDRSISGFRTADNIRLFKVETGGGPSAVVVSPDGKDAYVTNRADGTVVKVSGINTTTPATGPATPVGSEPVGAALSPSGKKLFVASLAEGRITMIRTDDMTVSGFVDGLASPRALAVTHNGDANDDDEHVIWGEFVGRPNADGEARDTGRTGHLRVFRASDLGAERDITLDAFDTGIQPTGTAAGTVMTSPNQLWAIWLQDNRLYIPSISASPEPPTVFDGNVYPIAYVADLTTGQEVRDATGTTNLARAVLDAGGTRVPGDIIDVAFSSSTQAWYLSRAGNIVQRITYGAGSVTAGPQIDLSANAASPFCRTPTGITSSVDGSRLFVNCLTTRNLTVIDTATSDVVTAIATTDPAPDDAAQRGRHFFFTGRGRWSNENWSSCASCHPDGLSDNMTWVFPAGPRQTTSLDGSFSKRDGKQRIFNWTGIFDEMADFERNTRGVSGGKGAITTALPGQSCGDPANEQQSALPGNLGDPVGDLQRRAENCTPTDWDDIDAFVKTIRPPRGRQFLDAGSVAQGHSLFRAGNCAQCHGGSGWTVSRRFYTPSAANNAALATQGLVGPQLAAADPGAAGNIGPEQVGCVTRQVGTFGVPQAAGATDDTVEKKPDGSRAQGRGGYNVPSLYGLALGAPYLHHGQARTLEDLFRDPAWGEHLRAGNPLFQPTPAQLAALTTYLLSIDGQSPEETLPPGADTCPAVFPPVSPSLSTVVANPTTGVVADGDAQVIVTVKLRNVTGALMTGRIVTLSAGGAENLITQPPEPTDPNGVATGSITSTRAEDKRVTATADGVELDVHPTITFVGDAANVSPTASTVVANPTSGLTANGTDASTVTAFLVDEFSNRVAGVPVSITSSESTDTVTGPPATDATGTTAATLQTTLAGNRTVTATANRGLATEVVLLQTPQVNFGAGPPDLTKSTVEVTPDGPIRADGQEPYVANANLVDTFFNPVANHSVIATASPLLGSFSPPSGSTGPGGRFTTLFSSIVTGSTQVQFLVDGNTLPGPTTTFAPGPPVQANSAVAVNPQGPLPADGQSRYEATATLRDLFFNPVTFQNLDVTAAPSSNKFSFDPPTGATGSAGTFSTHWGSTKATTSAIAFAVPGAFTLPGPFRTFNPGPPSGLKSTVSLSPVPARVPADGASAATLTVTVLDANDNPIVGAIVAITGSRGGTDTVTPEQSSTDPAGKVIAAITSFTQGNASFTITLNPGAGELVLAARPSVEFLPTGGVRITSFTANKPRAQIGGLRLLSWSVQGTPTAQSLTGTSVNATDTSASVTPSFTVGEIDPFAGIRLTATDAATPRFAFELELARHAGGGRTLGNAVVNLADGGFVVTGRFEGTVDFGGRSLTASSGPEIFLARYNAQGALTLLTRAGGGDYAEGFGIAATPSGGVVVTGAFLGGFTAGEGEPGQTIFTSDGFDGVTLSFRPDLTLEWARPSVGSGFEQSLRVTVLPDGATIAAGQFNQGVTFGAGERNQTTLSPTGSFDISIVRYERDGSLGWAKQIGSSRFDTPGALSFDRRTGGVTIVGGFGQFGGLAGETGVYGAGEPGQVALAQDGAGDLFVARYRPDGSLLDAKRAGGASFEDATAAAPGPNGSVYLAGALRGNAVFGPGEAGAITLMPVGNTEAFVARYDATLKPIFAKRIAASGALFEIRSATRTADGQLVITGRFNGTATFNPGEADEATLDSGGTKVTFIAVFNADGSLALLRKEGGPGETSGIGVAASDDGRITITGFFNGTATFGAGELGEASFDATAIEEMFTIRFFPVNTRTVVLRPEGLGYAKRAGSTGTDAGLAIGGFLDGSGAFTGSFGGMMSFEDGQGGQITITPSSGTNDFLANVRANGSTRCAIRMRQGGFGATRGLAAHANGDVVVTGDFFVDGNVDPGDTIFDPTGSSPIRLTSAGNTDMFVARFDKDCRVLWAKRGGGSLLEQAFAVARLVDGGSAVGGTYQGSDSIFGLGEAPGSGNEGQTTLPNAPSASGFLAVYNQDGTLRWVRRAGGTGFTEENPDGVAAFPNGDIVAAGSFSGDGFFPDVALSAVGRAAFVVRFNAVGTRQWVVQVGASPLVANSKARGKRVAVLPDGDVVVAGEFLGTIHLDPGGPNETELVNSSVSSTDVFVARYRGSDGSLVWAQRLGGGVEDTVRGIDTFPDDRIVVGGGFNGTATFGRPGDPRQTMLSTSGDFDEDMYVLVLEPNGDLVTVRRTGAGGSNTTDERANGLAALADGSVLVTGSFRSASVIFGEGEANQTILPLVGGFSDLFFARFFPYLP